MMALERRAVGLSPPYPAPCIVIPALGETIVRGSALVRYALSLRELPRAEPPQAIPPEGMRGLDPSDRHAVKSATPVPPYGTPESSALGYRQSYRGAPDGGPAVRDAVPSSEVRRFRVRFAL